MSVAVVVRASSNTPTRAAALAAQLSLPLLDAEAPLPDGIAALLQFDGDVLQLLPADAKQSGPVFVDFCAGANAHRLQGGAELIVKAVRGRSKETLHVLDATAGLGRDSFVLASRGFGVHMLERSPIVAALLADGLERACASGDTKVRAIAAQLSLTAMDATTYLQTLDAAQFPDVIYLDPMFPPSEKSALVKKDMRLFQQLFHSAHDRDDDHVALLGIARQCAKVRVVVKRPRKAQALAGLAPDYALEGKAVRFDVYVTKAVGAA